MAGLKKYATYAGSGVAGFLAGHACCIVTPFLMVSIGMTTATAALSGLALLFSAAVTSLGLYLWYRLRGKLAGTWERRFVIGSAATGLLLSSALHLALDTRLAKIDGLPSWICRGGPRVEAVAETPAPPAKP